MNRKTIALDLYEQGHSSRAVARLSGISSSYVRKLVAEAGIGRPVGLPGRPRNDNSKGAGGQA